MNVALLPLSLMYAWSTLAVPEGTPGYVGAIGTVNTCTASGFISLVFALAVPTYYGSLALQAYLGIKSNFKEEKYVWIEKWVHFLAYFLPVMYAIIIAATDNFNPNGSGCWFAKYPKGCDEDPEIPCRGKDIDLIIIIIGLTQICLYFVFPPTVIIAMYCWMRKQQKKSLDQSGGMSAIRESAKREMMQSIYLQISVYLFSFWSIWVPGLINNVYTVLTGEMIPNLQIFANCIFAFQGFVFTSVYFALQRMGRPNIAKVECIRTTNATSSSYTGHLRRSLTVSDIRLNAKRKDDSKQGVGQDITTDNGDLAESYRFNIFDGTPDETSPWAQYIDQDELSDDEGGHTMGDEEENIATREK